MSSKINCANYDSNATIFSPDGELLQVQYAEHAANRGFIVVGAKCSDTVVLGAELSLLDNLHIERTRRKVCLLDDRIMCAFSGVSADAQTLIKQARAECKSYKNLLDEDVTVEHISRFIADIQHAYTAKKGSRPFGVSWIIAGFDSDYTSHLYSVCPSGCYFEWKATAIGLKSREALAFMEKNYDFGGEILEQNIIQLTIDTLFQHHKSPVATSNDFEINILKPEQEIRCLSSAEIEQYVDFV